MRQASPERAPYNGANDMGRHHAFQSQMMRMRCIGDILEEIEGLSYLTL